MKALAKRDRDKLVAILGMLGSDFDGERAAAGLKATELLRARGLTWSDVVPARRGATPPPGQPAWCNTRADDLDLCTRHFASLRRWEADYVISFTTTLRVSPKQRRVLHEIACGLRDRGLG